MRFYSLILGISIILTTQASELDAQSSGYFPIGVWCTDFEFEPNQPDDKLVPQIERDLIRDLGITYLIACIRDFTDDRSIANYTDDEMNAGNILKTNISNRYDANIALWKTYGQDAEKYILPPADTSRINWINGVESTIENMDTNYASRPGFADILIGAEENQFNANAWPGFNFMARRIDSIRTANGSNAKSVFQTSVSGETSLPMIENMPDVDIFMPIEYPFFESTPYSSINDQGAFDIYIAKWSPVISNITEVNGSTGDMLFHPVIQAYADSNTVTQQMVHRFPTPEEFLGSVNIALAYGAKGITLYLYASLIHFSPNSEDHWAFGLVSDTNPRQPSGMYYTVKDVIDNYLSKISQEYLSLDWQSAFTSGETPPSGSVVTGISGASHIEIGNFTHQQSGESYFLLVNRVTNNSDGTPASPQSFTVSLEQSGSRRLVEDVLASREPWDENPNRVAYHMIDTNEQGFTVELKPGEGRLFRLSTSGLSGTITEDRYWSGEVWVENEVIFDSSATIDIAHSTEVKFSSSGRLRPKGPIIAEGTAANNIIFRSVTDAAPPFSWLTIFVDHWNHPNPPVSSIKYATIKDANNGIFVKNANNLTIQNCTIKNNRIGVYPYYAEGTVIKNNVIKDNERHNIYSYVSDPEIYDNTLKNAFASGYGYGIYLYASDAIVGGNLIQDNNLDGIRAVSSSAAEIQYSTTFPNGGDNEITQNDRHGIHASNGALPLVGNAPNSSGNNCIDSNANYEIANYSSGTIIAENNGWGFSGPSHSKFTGNVDHHPYISISGCGGAQAYSIFKWFYDIMDLAPVPVQAQATGAKTLLRAGLDDLLKGDNVHALNNLHSVISSHPDSDESLLALLLASKAYKRLGRKADFKIMLEDLKDEKAHSKANHYAKRIYINVLERNREFEEALSFADEYISGDLSADEKADVMFNQAMILAGGVEDTSGAIDKFNEIQRLFPRSEFAFMAAEQLEYLSMGGLHKGTGRSSILIPKTYDLKNNYPNPFNPETKINFVLAEDGLTKLLIYDLRGREVARLIDKNLNAGNHSVKWNASGFASGIYFYTLQSGNFVQTKKMVFLK